MSLLHLNFDEISESSLIRLATDSIAESKTLEYKSSLVYETDEQKREFLSDVSALANTDGGDLLLGMSANKGIASELCGLKNLVADDAINKIENLLRDFIQPRLTGVQIKHIDLENGYTALLMRIPQSFAAPHMVRHRGVTRFCGRNAAGKYDLDVHELRSAFIANESYADRLKSFRIDRINRILASSSPVKLSSKHILVLHILPLVGVRSDSRIDPEKLKEAQRENALRPIASNGYGARFNFDGILSTSSNRKGDYHSYVQLFRNGYLESVDSRTLAPSQFNPDEEPRKLIPSVGIEKSLLNAYANHLNFLSSKLGIPPPYAVSVSLLNVKGYHMGVSMSLGYNGSHIDREHLLTEEILIESCNDEAAKQLRPIFDQIWNACDWEGSQNYDPDGNWVEQG